MPSILEVAIELLSQCPLFVDDSLNLIGLGRVGLNTDEASVLMAKKIIPTRLLIESNPERLVSVEAVGELSTNRRINKLFILVLDCSQSIPNKSFNRGSVG